MKSCIQNILICLVALILFIIISSIHIKEIFYNNLSIIFLITVFFVLISIIINIKFHNKINLTNTIALKYYYIVLLFFVIIFIIESVIYIQLDYYQYGNIPNYNYNYNYSMIDIFLSIILFPFVEEYIFRGLLLTIIKKYIKHFSIIVISLLFTLYHIGQEHNTIAFLIFVFITSLLLGIISYKLNSIYLCIFGHIIHNFLILLNNYFLEQYNTNMKIIFNNSFNRITVFFVTIILIIFFIFISKYFYKKYFDIFES